MAILGVDIKTAGFEKFQIATSENVYRSIASVIHPNVEPDLIARFELVTLQRKAE
jgi:hypothetical protein